MSSNVKVCAASGTKDAYLWDRFVENHAESSNYHRWRWKQVIENSFDWPTHYLMVRQGDTIRGVLPLVWQRSRIFGSFLTSLPYFNYGGIIAEGHEAEQALLREAIGLARQLRATHLELRHRRDHTLGLPLKTNKVSVICEVQTDAERMWRSLPHKVPTDIRKPMKSGLTAEFGGAELLNEFYSVFAENMRDLGTPVYSKKFFAEILRTFPEDSYICLTRHDGSPAAASFLLGYRNTLEVPWSSSLRRYRSMKPNMLLYWKSLCFAGERGYQIFDFGRSSIGSGTYRFKMQWGGQEVPLQWDYWLPEGKDLPGLNPQNPHYRLAISIWQKLPVAITKLIGPSIVRCLP